MLGSTCRRESDLKIKLILINVMHNIQFFQQQLNQSSEPISHTNIHW